MYERININTVEAGLTPLPVPHLHTGPRCVVQWHRAAAQQHASGSGSGSMVGCSVGRYPPQLLAGVAVSELSRVSSNSWSACAALAADQRCTRGMVSADGCCKVVSTDVEKACPFYFGVDKDGYVLVLPKEFDSEWPAKKRRPMPVRLTRWLLNAPTGSVVRHRCDNPGCISVSHLQLGSHSDNLRDNWRRRRRGTAASRSNSFHSPRARVHATRSGQQSKN